MKYRKLRIAWSAIWCILCLLLIALWVRSYWVHDVLRGKCPVAAGFHCDLTCGVISFDVFTSNQTIEWTWNTGPPMTSHYKWWFRKYDTWYHVAVPHGFLVLIAGSIALTTAPWTKLRFSLRTLLIAMTLAAVVLGVIVFSMQ
jgi:hypothetical protein